MGIEENQGPREEVSQKDRQAEEQGEVFLYKPVDTCEDQKPLSRRIAS